MDLPNPSAIFHTVYDLNDRYQVPGARYRQTGVTEKCNDCPLAWKGIYDDQGRVMVAMTFDSDLGDSWEWADDPSYDEKFSASRYSHRRELHHLCDDALTPPYVSVPSTLS